MILFNSALDKEIEYYEKQIRECEKYGNEIGAESWRDIIRLLKIRK